MDNAKAYEFINSKDIREHLKKLEYPLTPVECAFLVWQSKRHTLKEKHEAWNDLIKTLPDCPVEERMNCKGWDSLHDMLRGYMAAEQKLLDKFRAEENNTVYEYELWEEGPDDEYRWDGRNRHFHSLRVCRLSALEEAREEKCRFRIIKHYIDERSSDYGFEPYISAEFNPSGEILEIFPSGSSTFFSLTDEEDDLLFDSFAGMWFDIPIPFEKGDIVCDNAEIYAQGMPFVLMGTVPWYRKEHPPKHGTYSDYSDMNAYGWFYDREQQFFHDDFRVDYLNLEYYTKPLQGGERLLLAYSQFVKEQIDGYTLLKLYRLILAEAAAEKEQRSLASYLPGDIWGKYSPAAETDGKDHE